MTQAAEDAAKLLVEERVMQLQEISKRRNDLLCEMFHLIQKRDNLGSVLATDDDDEHGLQGFLERFDLEKHPDTGYIASLSEDEVALPDTPPAYSPVGLPPPELAPDPEPEPEIDVRVSESPISEPPVSPVVQKREEEAQPEIPETPQPDIPMDIDDAAPAPPTEEAHVSLEEEDIIEIMTSPEPSPEPSHEPTPELHTAPQSPSPHAEPVRPTEDLVPEKSPTPELPPATAKPPTPERPPSVSKSPSPVPQSPTVSPVRTRESSTSKALPTQEERSPSPSSPALANNEASVIKAEPLDDEVMEDNGNQTQDVPSLPDPPAVPLPPAVPAAMPVSNQRSEDQIMTILGPSQDHSSPAHELEEQHTAVKYSIPLPAAEQSALFTFQDDAESIEMQSVTEPPSPFGPEPGFPPPPLSLLPVEFSRRKATKRKRDKDTSKPEFLKEWQPMSLNKWAAILKANPVHLRLSKAPKILSTRDWSVGMAELRLIRVFDRIEKLKDNSAWSFRQPKKQRGVGGLTKTHWDYLMDEVKWMRTDFREERRWKLALAYNLVHAVVEWHEAGTREERVRRGIVVLWQPPPPEDVDMVDANEGEQEDTDENGVESRETGTPLDGYATDDESDDEQEKQDGVDSLEPSAVLQEALQQLEDQASVPSTSQANSQDAPAFRPKMEEIEDLTALGKSSSSQDETAMEVDEPKTEGAEKPREGTNAKPSTPNIHPGLKSSSKNPVMNSNSKEGESSHGKTKHKINQYAALRERIISSDADKLFVDLDDLELVKSMSELSTEDPLATAAAAFAPPPLPHDLSDIFPDLQPYTMPEVAPTQPEVRKKGERKSDRDDPNKRAEDVTYAKLSPASKYMHVKPVLVGTLKPASNYKDEQWSHIEDPPVFADIEIPPARPLDDNLCSLFEGTGSKPTPSGHPSLMPPPRDVRKRNAEHHTDAITWLPSEDMLLKQAVERYAYNWNLIADAFNSSRVSIVTDRRTPWECLERWREKHAAQARAEPDDNGPASASTSASASHMTTRGFKRSATQAMASGSGSATAPPNEPRKRRRHNAMNDTLRKAAKRREAVQKSNAAPRAKPSVVHDTHGQFTKMPKLTPAELSRMKAEKEARDAQELILRRKNDELARQQMLRDQAARAQQGLPPNAPQQQPQPPQMQVPNTNGVPRPANGVAQPPIVQQIRSSQVGISQQQQQQQRLAAALAGARMSPTQFTTAQAAHLRALAQAQAQNGQAQAPAQGQAVAQAQVPQVSNASAALTAAAPALSAAHLSPSFGPRAISSSPGVPQQSPPLPAASPANVSAPPRTPSVPAQPVQGIPVNPMAHIGGQQNIAAQYYMQQMQQMQQRIQTGLTPEQLQALMAQQVQRQYAAHAQQPQAQHPPNGSFSHT